MEGISIVDRAISWLAKRLSLTETVYIEPEVGLVSNPRDRLDYDRETVIAQALEAWRVNPLARRIVGLISQYVVGGGISINSPDGQDEELVTDQLLVAVGRRPALDAPIWLRPVFNIQMKVLQPTLPCARKCHTFGPLVKLPANINLRMSRPIKANWSPTMCLPRKRKRSTIMSFPG